MIYDSLRTLPYLTALDIMRTGDVYLLTDDKKTPAEDLVLLWSDVLLPKFQALFNATGEKKIFNATKEIEFLSGKYEIIVTICRSLEFAHSPELVDQLREYGYMFREEMYQQDLRRTLREVEGIKVKISQLQQMLPKKPEGDIDTDNEDMVVMEQMAAYSAILSIDFDFNTVSCAKFKALEYQVKTKIKQLEKSNSKSKSK